MLIAQTEASRLTAKRDHYAHLLKLVQSNEVRDDILYVIGYLNDRIAIEQIMGRA